MRVSDGGLDYRGLRSTNRVKKTKGGDLEMLDPLAVAQIETKQVIADLEDRIRTLHDVNAQVSIDALRRLKRLRLLIEETQAGYSRGRAITVLKDVLVSVSSEVVKWIGTSIWILTAPWVRLRAFSYAFIRRSNSSPPSGSSPYSGRLGGGCRHIGVSSFVNREWPA